MLSWLKKIKFPHILCNNIIIDVFHNQVETMYFENYGDNIQEYLAYIGCTECGRKELVFISKKTYRDFPNHKDFNTSHEGSCFLYD